MKYGKATERRGGFSLVELLLALLILIFVALGWFKIMNAAPMYKEAQKRAAIELAAGILDVFFPGDTPRKENKKNPLGYYRFVGDEEDYPFMWVPTDERQYFPESYFPKDSNICYTLRYRMGYLNFEGDDFKDGDTKANNATAYGKETEKGRKWKSFCDKLKDVSDRNDFNPYVVEIALFESKYSKKPFAVFDQLVGYKNMAQDLGGY